MFEIKISKSEAQEKGLFCHWHKELLACVYIVRTKYPSVYLCGICHR
jgi:hypothetical protein